MIFSKVRCTTKREKCQSFLCRSALGNYSILGLCFHLESSIKWANRYDACGEGREACYDEKVARPTLPNNTESAIVKKIHLMNVLFFCLELGGTAMTMGGSRHGHEKWAAVLWWQPERTVPLNLAPGSQKEATDTFMHKCLLHTFNGCGPDGFFSPDALSMRAALRITAPAPPDGALSSISFFSASLNQWKFKNTPSGEVWIFK